MIEVKELRNYIESGAKVLVEFSSDGCAPCDAIKPIIKKVIGESKFKDVIFIEINLTKYPEFSVEFGVFGVPTIVIFKDGKEYGRQIGYMNEKKIRKFLGGLL